MIRKLSPVGGNVFAAVKKNFNAHIDNFLIIVKNSNQLMQLIHYFIFNIVSSFE